MLVKGRRSLSDQNSKTIDDYKNAVQLLENALQRERNSKKLLEQKLDEKAQQRLDENKEFLKAYQEATSRQIQLQFLSMLNQGMISDRSLKEMFDSYCHNLQQLLEQCPVFLASLTKQTSWQLQQLPTPSSSWQRIDLTTRLEDELTHLISHDQQHWHRQELNGEDPFSTLFHNSTMLFYVISISKSQQRIILLDINHYCYSDDFKNTLRVSGQSFTTAINKRMTEIELSYNNQKLKHTLSTLKKTQQQLAHNDKMASLGQLSAGIAHEINNPIGYVASNLGVLTDYFEIYKNTLNVLSNSLTDKEQEIDPLLSYALEDTPPLIEACKTGVDRVAAIVNSLKTFSRKEQDEFGEVNINDAINSAIEIVWNQLKYEHQLNMQLTPKLPVIHGNFGQLQQVFVNLFVNASHAMSEKGELTVMSQVIADEIEITVSDTGCGIEQKNIKRLFEPFYTTKKENEGTGLGLSVSYAIIEKHDANISVNSALDKGTTFTLRFPIPD